MLRNLFFSFIRFFLFWLLFFAITRATFEIYFHEHLRGVSALDIVKTFIYGIRMDASAAAYVAIIPLLVFIVEWFAGRRLLKPIWLRVYIWFLVFLASLIAIVDLGIFTEWGAKVNFRAFETLYNSPAESMSSTSSAPIALHVTIGIILLTLGVVLSHFIINFKVEYPKVATRTKVLCSVGLLIANFIILRGTLFPTPINQSSAYFSDNQLLDLSAQNTEWNLANNVFENLRHPYNPYMFMPEKRALDIVADNYKVDKDTTVSILTTNRPNVVIIQLESYTADLIESLGGERGVSPNFERLTKQGLSFNNIYAAGDRTDKGVIAILSAFPSQAIRTIIVDTVKQRKLPSLMAEFKDTGYHTSYFYGGHSNYMNFDTYMYDHKTDLIFDKSRIPANQIGSVWGAHDNILFQKNVVELGKFKQPFFSLVQTLTNHEPFVLPTPPHFKGKDLAEQFKSTAWFTDSCLNAYLETAKKQPWYKNTLFVIVADHGHRLPRSTSWAYSPAKYHIPLMFYGEVIKPEYRGQKITKLGNQTDIAATLLAQLGLPHNDFKWSKNLLNPYSKEFAFYDWDNGFGFLMPKQGVAYDSQGKRIIYRKYPDADKQLTEEALLNGKAFMQQIYTEYLAY